MDVFCFKEDCVHRSSLKKKDIPEEIIKKFGDNLRRCIHKKKEILILDYGYGPPICALYKSKHEVEQE